MPARTLPRPDVRARRSVALVGVLAVVLGLLLTLTPGATAADRSTGRAADEPASEPGLLPPLFPTPTPTTPAQGGQVDEGRLSRDYPHLPKRCGLLVEGQVPATPRRCVIKKAGRKDPVLVMWGDSHMWQMLPAIKVAMRGQKVGLVAFMFGSCPPSLPDMRIYAGNPCMETQVLAQRFLTTAKRQGRDVRVILGSFWGAHLDRMAYYENDTQRQQLRDRRAYVMKYTRPVFSWLGRMRIPTDVQVQGPAAVPPAPDCRPGPTPFQCDIPRAKALYADREVTSFLRTNMKRLPRGARLIDYHDAVCRDAVCPALQPGGQHTWFDPYHLSASTTATLSRFYVPTVRKLTR